MDTSFARRRRRDLIVAACLAVLAALVPLFVKDVYVQNIMVLTLMYAALSQSWNILSGYCGQISLGHALYFGLGAYATALLFTKFGVLPWFGMLPFLLFVGVVFVVPIAFILFDAFRRTTTGAVTRDPVTQQFIKHTTTSFTGAMPIAVAGAAIFYGIGRFVQVKVNKKASQPVREEQPAATAVAA